MLSRVTRLGNLAAAVPGGVVVGNSDQTIARVILDSRRVGPGDLFVAVPGLSVDRTQYVASAFELGAAAAAVERASSLPAGRSGIVVPSARLALGLLAAAREGYPSRQLRVIGVTGTDGKTTTSSLIASILRAAGRSTGVVSTIIAEIGSERIDTGFHTTTPDAPDLQRYLADMVMRGATDAVLEVTSHGLAQERVAGCDFDVAVITNVTGDHLDFHTTFENYLEAKLRLFAALDRSARKPNTPKVAVSNLDDVSAELIGRMPVDQRITYALERRADVRARGVRFTSDSTAFDAETPTGSVPVELRLTGWYNVANALAAIAASVALDVSPTAIQDGLARFEPLPGRFESIKLGQTFDVVVDFAHTAHSFEQVLALARERCRRRVHVVFGCAGLRDREKRPRMGEVAARYADAIYLTAEDPRTESLDQIIEEIAAGCRLLGRREGSDFWRIPDRREAIERAISNANEGDLVLLTGKGHERSMCFGTTEYPWSDQDAARDALTSRLAPGQPA
jgi:UDP-N-acetylmuramoyl-L-alanyl-D-glutamate--2,6-diaminopimelate ligase